LSTHSIKETIDKSISAVTQLAAKRGVKIFSHKVIDTNVVFDDDRIQQVIMNLLSNAIKFSTQNEGRVYVSTIINQMLVEISVKDNGRGIEKGDLFSIFSKFYQSKNQNILKPIGSGLGLAISKQIIESHKGKIWAENVYPQGARITFNLPLNN